MRDVMALGLVTCRTAPANPKRSVGDVYTTCTLDSHQTEAVEESPIQLVDLRWAVRR
jgi:hypothetical protein